MKERKSAANEAAAKRRAPRPRRGRDRGETEPQLRDLIENPLVGIYRTTVAGKFLYANETMARMLGFPSAEALMQATVPSCYQDPRDRERLLEMLRSGGTVSNFETALRTRTGGSVSILMNATLAGETVSGIVIDITDRKRAEAALREEKNKFEAIISAMGDGVVIQDRTHRVLYQNEVHRGFVGDHVGERCYEGYQNRSTECDECPVALSFLDGRVHVMERPVTRNGVMRYLEVTSSPLRDAEGTIVAGIEIVRDISERKKADDNLRQSWRRLQLLVDRMPVGCIMWTPDFRVDLWNPAAARIFGYSAPEAMGKTAYDLIVPNDVRPLVEESWQQLLAGDRTAHSENENLTRDGRTIVCEWHNTPIRDAEGRVTGVLTMVHDVTDRKRAEEALREERNFVTTILDTVEALVLVLDPQGRVIRFNKACERASGFSFDEIRGKNLWDYVILPEDAAGLQETFRSLTAGMFPNRHVNYWRSRDGGRKLISWVNTCLVDEQGAVTYVIPTGIDISEQEKAETFVRNILETVDEGFLVIDRELRVRTVNRAFSELVRMTVAEVVGKSCRDVVRGAYRLCDGDCDHCAVTRTLASGEPQVSVESYHGDGYTTLHIETKTFPLKDHAGQVSAVIAIVNDITEQKRLEAQLLQSQKMEAIGLLAGGVAHDFNNILSAIIGYASILQMKIPPDDPLRPNVEQVLAAAHRAAGLTQGLLAFSRKQIINPKPLQVNESLRKTERLLRRIIGEDIELLSKYAPEDRTILMDAGQLEQIIINLATNARDAMPDGGTLRIETEAAAMNDDFIRRHGYGQPGDYAVISVSDTGTGMDEQTRMRIFEPFFTTKEVGKGTGLGLSTVYGIVKQHNGFIECESEPGKGTAFHVFFPLVAAAPEPGPAAAPPPIRGGSETILVAEDDEVMRNLFLTVFTEHGYRVIMAKDGEDALRAFREHAEEIQLLMIDVIMPKKNGKEVYEEVRRVRPGVKVLFTSGYTDDIVHRKGILDEGIHFITKPSEPAAVLRKVRDVLDGL